MPEPIFLTKDKGQKIRIISPLDYDKIVHTIDKDYLRTIFNVAMWTGMRYVEIQKLHAHSEWVLRERKLIHLPREADRKIKRVAPARYVPVAPQIEGELNYFFNNKKPPCLQTWDVNLKRWTDKANLGTEGISAKMTRVSIEIWMFTAGMLENDICQRQGHDRFTSFNHYQALTSLFTETEKFEIQKRLAGWK
jgi:hypothetical protein